MNFTCRATADIGAHHELGGELSHGVPRSHHRRTEQARRVDHGERHQRRWQPNLHQGGSSARADVRVQHGAEVLHAGQGRVRHGVQAAPAGVQGDAGDPHQGVCSQAARRGGFIAVLDLHDLL